jgi:FKBP-type peptidyl-prolyl cis-trans isomerase
MQADLAAAVGLGLSALGVLAGRAASHALVEALPTAGKGFASQVIREGSGIPAGPGDRVTLHFVVRTFDGKELANSQKRGLPYSVILDSREPFWNAAVGGMRKGGTTRFQANSSNFFGNGGILPIVPPDTMIEAELSLLSVRRTVVSSALTANHKQGQR